MDLDGTLSKIWTLTSDERDKGMKLILKILLNVIKNPHELKYRRVNLKRLTKKFNNKLFIELLHICGFHNDKDNIRLMLYEENVENVQRAYDGITNYKQQRANPYNTLILKDEEKRVVDYLVQMGYENTVSIMALHICPNISDISGMIDAINKLKEQQNIRKILETSQHKSNETNSKQTLDDAVKHLVNIGFDGNQSLQALVYAKYDFQIAVDILLQKQPSCQIPLGNEDMKCIQITSNNCGYCASECQFVSKLVKLLNEHVCTIKEVTSEELNYYHHVLLNHNADDDFEYIYDQIVNCDIAKCDAVGRYNQRATSHSDTIHCHFMHSYDFGYRSAPKCHSQKKIIKQRTCAINKFKRLSNSCCNENTEYSRYSFGTRFYYWPFFKDYDVNDVIPNQKHKCCHFYVGPKFNNFKAELLNNNLTKEQFDNEYNKAKRNLHTYHCKKIVAHPDTSKSDSKQDDQKSPYKHSFSENAHWNVVAKKPPQFDTAIYGIAGGTPITVNHLVSIIVYCGYDDLSHKFSESFRKLKKNESDEELKKRHGNFHFLAKYIVEAVTVYGTEQHKKNITSFYHGIDTQMIFNDIRCIMYQPFSTTSSWEVAVHFSDNSGMILEVSCSMIMERYFDCAWISDFPSESEKLFIRNSHSLQIQNITVAPTGISFRKYIQALAVLDCFTEATPFQSDFNLDKRPRLFHTIGDKTIAVDRTPIPPIDPMVQLLTVKLIKHELSRYSHRKGEKMEELHPYIQKLLHNICINKCSVKIEMSLFDFNLDDEKVQNHMSLFYRCRYQRLPFLKNVFFDEESNTVRIDLLSAIYPHSFCIVISNIKGYISPLYFHSPKSIWFDRMLQYLTNIGQVINSIQLLFIQKQRPTLKSLVASYSHRYIAIGWCIGLMSSQEIILRKTSEMSDDAVEVYKYPKLKAMLKQWGKYDLVISPVEDFTYD